MASKPVKSLNGKKLSGLLSKPIDHGLFMPLDADSSDWPSYLAEREKELRRHRMAKMPALARHLGIDVDQLDLSPTNGVGWMMLYSAVAEKLAAEVVPGFQEKPRGKHPREIVRYAREVIDAVKAKGKFNSDLDACCEIIKLWHPELTKPGRKSELVQKAKTLQNRIAADRSKSVRERSGS